MKIKFKSFADQIRIYEFLKYSLHLFESKRILRLKIFIFFILELFLHLTKLVNKKEEKKKLKTSGVMLIGVRSMN